MDPHPDFAVSLAQRLVVRTNTPHPESGQPVAGPVLAIGWYVDPNPTGTPVGTLYLVADDSGSRPLWLAQARLTGLSVDP